MRNRRLAAAATMAGWLAAPTMAGAQTTLDRVDPAKIEAATRPRDDMPANAAPIEAPRRAAASAVGRPITVGAITVRGLERTRVSDLADIFELYAGRTLSPAALAGLADAVADRLHARGFVFATAAIPAQAMTAGVLHIVVDEGRVDEVRILGPENSAVRAAMEPLVGVGPVTLPEVERRLLIAGDIDGLWLKRTRFVREKGRDVLVVDIGADPIAATIGLDNFGSRPIGPLQADLTVRRSQLFSAADLLTLSVVLTPAQPGEFAYGRLRYATRVSRDGMELWGGFSYSEAHPGSYLASRDIAGRSWLASAGVLQPLLRRRGDSLWLDGSFSLRTVRQYRADLLARRDRIAAARIGVYGFTAALGGRLRADATVNQGLDILGATKAADPLASRRDADGSFTTLSLSSDWTGPIAGPLSARLALTVQLASRPLLVSEEAGLGGGQYLRGYGYSERTGDDGTMISGELRYAIAPKLGPLGRPTLYTFADGGRVTNLRGGLGSGTLFSAGAGFRTLLGGRLSADAGLAIPLSGPRYDSGNAHPVFNFRLASSF